MAVTNKWDEYYGSNKDFMPIHPKLLALATNRINDGGTNQTKKALDFGCGTGKNSLTLLKMGYEVDGIDASSEAIKRAKDRQIDAQFKVGSVESIPVKPAYDLVLISLVYKFINNKKQFLDTIYTCLKAGGRLVLYNPSSSLKNISVDHVELKSLLDETGFSSIKEVNTSYCGMDILVTLSAIKKQV